MRTVVLTAALVGAAATNGQVLVQELGGGVGIQGVHYIEVDEQNNGLWLVGQFAWANNQQVSPGILRWDSGGLSSIGCGIGWDCVSVLSQAGLANPALTAVSWNGDLYLGGRIGFTRNGQDFDHLMRWDGFDWHPVPGLDGPVYSLKVVDDALVAVGWFVNADTVVANGLAKWDGSGWSTFIPVPKFSTSDINRVNDIVQYQGEWYLGGNLGTGIRDLGKWNGTSWESVGGGFLGVFSQVNKLRVYDGRLYVAGSFNRCPEHAGVASNPGSGIVAWDGSTWDDLGGGTCGASNGSVNSIAWWNNELYATGIFNRIGGQEGHRIAKWNGQHWCMLTPPGYWGTGGPAALAVHNDSLYIGGAFLQAGPDSVSCFVKWVGGDYTYSCGALGVGDASPSIDELSCYPNPTDGLLNLSLPNWATRSCEVSIADLAGRVVLRRQSPDGQLDVSALAAGSYVVRLFDRHTHLFAHTRFTRR